MQNAPGRPATPPPTLRPTPTRRCAATGTRRRAERATPRKTQVTAQSPGARTAACRQPTSSLMARWGRLRAARRTCASPRVGLWRRPIAVAVAVVAPDHRDEGLAVLGEGEHGPELRVAHLRHRHGAQAMQLRRVAHCRRPAAKAHHLEQHGRRHGRRPRPPLRPGGCRRRARQQGPAIGRAHWVRDGQVTEGNRERRVEEGRAAGASLPAKANGASAANAAAEACPRLTVRAEGLPRQPADEGQVEAGVYS